MKAVGYSVSLTHINALVGWVESKSENHGLHTANLLLNRFLHWYFVFYRKKHSFLLWKTNYIFFPYIQCAHFSVDQVRNE